MMTDYEIKMFANQIRESFCNSIPTDVYKTCKELYVTIYLKKISSGGYLICENGFYLHSQIILLNESDIL